MKKVFALIAVVTLGGCAQPPATKPYRPVTTSRHEIAAQPTTEHGVQSLGGPLTLTEALAIALAHNPDTAAAGWDSQAAQARYEYAMGERWPRLSAMGNYAHHLDEQRLLPVRQPGDPAILSRDIVSGDLVLTMPIYTGGRLVNQIEAAKLLQEAAGHRLARSRQELIFNVSSVFFSILAQGKVIESLEFSQKSLEEHLKQVNDLIAANKAAKVERLRTEVRLADVRQRLVKEQNVMAVQHRALASMLGLEDQGVTPSVQGDLQLDGDASVPELKTALAKAWSDRDDYLAAKSALEAQARAVEVARAGHAPTVFLQGSYGGRWAVGTTIGTGDELDDVGRIGVGLGMLLLDGGQVNAKVREQRAALAAARERLRKIELQIRLDVETASLNICSSRERVTAIQTSVEQAQESLRIEREKYELGKGTIVDVLDAQSALLDAQTNYYRALADYHVALAQLELAMGKS